MTAAVPGLTLVPEWISGERERDIIAAVDALPWDDGLRRRVQHHGYRYAYRGRKVDAAEPLGPLPTWAAELAARLHGDAIFTCPPDQVIVNEYVPGQGISAHIDCVPCFGPVIASLSLGSGATLELSHPTTSSRAAVWLPPRSLLVLADDARYRWRHAIPARKSDPDRGPRGRRLSLTFRTVLRDRRG
ncbi:alpha-ketoglutarate-dependent dioxygenase AlkB [Nannocystis sp. ILAH1]|uniref:alpha-ketoglutarate-dependent dioxygenase AlkB n=1 Tax=unclassified Nannocystis TaxID=2627009 RepID=UPI00226DD0CB|nr:MULTISPECIES: alpha-ketoglutarate-dependent dioxygenase AlkB [unclassified Nannocystis]MCY0994044.1 alpha-ketoglutarate-dependent dioxygenase AlkB [Nannocystis sp. ILAH1]MCY1067012.1 alpha-ketoglutarate-dependent dioxygenase AlkB [Nannocystis sp. RBIL2]